MPNTVHQADPLHVLALLRRWLAARVNAQGMKWLEHAREELLDGAPDRVFFAAYGDVPRHVGDDDLDLSNTELGDAMVTRRGWDPRHWTTSEAARAFLLLSLDDSDAGTYRDVITELLKERTDLGGMIALCRGLPIMPFPERHRPWAVEVTRTDRKVLFEAVALHNPFPAERFHEDEWNQMVVKALFLGSTLGAIQDLDRRLNHALAHMVREYAHERWANGGRMPPEAWRLIGPFADEPVLLADLKRALADSDPAQQEAAALALSQCRSDPARELLAGQGDLQAAIAEGRLSWEHVNRPART